MKKAWQTTEFWAALVTNVIGLVVLFGGLTAEQGSTVSGELQTIAGSILAILSALGYIGNRTMIKVMRAKLVMSGNVAIAPGDLGL